MLLRVSLAKKAWTGLKTVTRRPIAPQPVLVNNRTWEWPHASVYAPSKALFDPSKASWGRDVPPEDCMSRFCDLGQPGERLWFRTTWYHHYSKKDAYNEQAWDEVTRTVRWKETGQQIKGCEPKLDSWWKKRPSLHMFRWACGQVYDILSVRAERLWDITEAECKAEGVDVPVSTDGCPPGKAKPLMNLLSPFLSTHMNDVKNEADCVYRVQFAFDWDQLYGKGPYAWGKNPWVWVIGFKKSLA